MKQQQNIIFSVENITKKFGGITALNNVSLAVHAGKTNVIVGENGAGKSTLMKIMSGVYPNYKGKLFLGDKEVHFNTPKEAMQNGIAIVHQELHLVPYLSITENIFLGREIRNSFGLLDIKAMHKKTMELLERIDCKLAPKTLISNLRIGEQQLIEIAKALLKNAQVVIMDEPTSAISDTEVAVLFKIIASLKKQGVTILYISHKLDELFKIADRFIGLRDGKMAGTIENPKQTTKEDLIRLMVGRDLTNSFLKTRGKLGNEVLRVENLSLKKHNDPTSFILKDINFTLKKGEVLGVFGLMGAGRTALLEALFGLHSKKQTGAIFIDNKKVEIKSVSNAIALGIGLVPEDRKNDGLVLDMQVLHNISLANVAAVCKNGFLNDKSEISLAKKHITQLSIKTSSEKQLAKNLSGGNQQKIVLAKWLATTPKILFLDEPTRGIDVNAKNEIYQLIDRLAKTGLGLVVVSSELPEIMAISDRILVLSNTTIAAEFNQENATEEQLMNAAI